MGISASQNAEIEASIVGSLTFKVCINKPGTWVVVRGSYVHVIYIYICFLTVDTNYTYTPLEPSCEN